MSYARIRISLALLPLLAPALPAAPPEATSANVVLVMTDGLRVQEVFEGADPLLLNKEHGAVSDPEELKRLFWRDSPQARREALLPFLWTTIAKQGQIFGNRKLGSEAYVVNGRNFSYPGYNETLCGFADPRIDSNADVPNRNVTVLEWLHRKPAFRDKVAAFGAWHVIGSIVNAARGGFFANAGRHPVTVTPVSKRMALLNRLKADTRHWEDMFDSLTFHTALEYVKQRKPRVLFLSLGETDEWSHQGKYDRYLLAAHRTDGYLKELWETLQSMPEYRDKTSLIFVPDHGRGEAPVEWKSHGQKIPDSKYIWMALMGPGIPALGERSKTRPVTQSQVAATLAALLGEDYVADVPAAGKPISDALPK